MAAIELEGLERRYGERVALGGVTRAGGGGPDARRARRQRRRQDDAAARARGAAAPARRRRARARRRAAAARRWKVRGRVGYLGHDPLLYRELTGRENLRYHARLHGVDAGAGGGAARRGRHGAPRRRAGARPLAGAWCSGWRSRGRCCTTRRCCCSTSRARTSTRPPPSALEPLIGRASGRTRVLVTHDVEGGARRGRPGARAARRARRRSAGRAPEVARPAQRARELVPRDRAPPRAILRKDLHDRAAHEGVRAGDDAVHASPSTCCSTSGSTATRSTASSPRGCCG